MNNVAMTVLAILCFAALQADPVPFTVLQEGGWSGVETRREVVVRTEEELKALRFERPDGSGAPLSVDFKKSMIVGVFAGTRPTGGQSVAITRIDRDGPDLVVTYREQGPRPGEMATQVITTPFQLVTTDQFAGRVRFVRAR